MANSFDQLKHAEELLLLRTSHGQEPVEHADECSDSLLQSLGGPATRTSSSGNLGGNDLHGHQEVTTLAHLEKLADDGNARRKELVTRYSSRPMPDDVASEIEQLAARQTVLKNPSSANRLESQSWVC
jgi:hypothetical protein